MYFQFAVLQESVVNTKEKWESLGFSFEWTWLENIEKCAKLEIAQSFRRKCFSFFFCCFFNLKLVYF